MFEIIARVLFFVLATVVAVGGIALLIDAVRRRSWSRRPDVELRPCHGGDSDTVFVVLPTHQMRTQLLMENIIEQLAGYGVVYRVDGAELRFDAEWTIDEMVESLHMCRRIVLVAPGSSLMLAISLAIKLQRYPIVGRDISIVTIDGMPLSSFINPKSQTIARLPFGPIANWLMRQVRLSRWTRWNFTPSVWRDHMKFIRSWYPGEPLDAALVYIRSGRAEQDKLFMAPAIAGNHVGGNLIETITVPDTGELDILHYPQRYETAVERALRLLEVERVS